jgi:pimeloyl-ACP methyl ester carboxylesterase
VPREYTLFGHSFGAMVALTHAVAFPGHASRLVLSAPVADETVFEDLEERLDAFGRGAKAAFERERNVRTEAEARDVWLDQLPFFVAEPGGAGERAMAAALTASAHSVPAALHEGWGDLELLGRLREIRVPTLVLAGAQDRMFPLPVVGAVAHGIPGAQLEVIGGAGHFAFAEQPDAFFGVLEAWLP